MSDSVSSRIQALLDQSSSNTLLRFATAGSVDDGKSTLIGRLLHDSKNIYEDHLAALEAFNKGGDEPAGATLALLTDGLKAEREQGITIDVAYRYFSTPKRHFILADTPGHEQYTRNMATGCSTANLVIILIDARSGVVTQTKRHAFIASLLGIPRFLVTINKMDLVDYSQEVFERIQADFLSFAARLGITDVRCIPISALVGDNVVERSEQMPWYEGVTVMNYLENVYTGGDQNLVDFRFPVQYVLRPNHDYRGYAGQVLSGLIRVGDEVLVLPSKRRSRVKSIDVFGRQGEAALTEAFAPMSVAVALEDEIDISRGDMLVRPENAPQLRSSFEAMLVWMSDTALDPSQAYWVLHTTRQSKVFFDEIKYRVDVNTLHREATEQLELNEIGRVRLTSAVPLLLDPYRKNRATGCFVIVDPLSFQTVAAGMVIDRLPEEMRVPEYERDQETGVEHRSDHIHKELSYVTPAEREQRLGGAAVTVWLTGLSGSGKSSIARGLERELFDQGRLVYRLDGDNLRFGLNRDLGFSAQDRSENIRRVAEVARLFNLAGVTVICSFISPFRADRAQAREIVGSERFVEVHLSTSLDVCEERDPHGLYHKARSGEIREFTGISSPYEPPLECELSIDTGQLGLTESIELVKRCLK